MESQKVGIYVRKAQRAFDVVFICVKRDVCKIGEQLFK